MTHSVSLASSLGAAQSVAGTESTFLTSRQSNFSSASLADSFTLREHGSGGVAVMRSQLLDDSWQDAPYQICEGQLGPVLINLQMDVPTTIHESQGGSSSSPPRAQQQTAAKESGRKGLLKRLGSVVSRKGGLAPPTTSSVSAFARSPTGATTASISTTRRVLAATQATVFFQGFWIPGDCAEGPRDLEDAGRWLSRIARYEEEINTGDALVLSDGSTVVVPEWAATFSKMLMFGLV